MLRSRLVKDLDKNTRYFHNIVSTRRKNNKIDALVINGSVVRNQARIKIAIREFYKNLYHQEESPMVSFRDGLVDLIDEEDTAALKVLPSSEEIKKAVWDCESSRALGSDGYNMNFIKKCWDEIGTEFTTVVLGFFQTSRLLKDSNLTWVALAPKFFGVIEIKNLRPISMFADDTVLFCPPEEESVKNYKRLLCCFKLMSGLNINFEKSSLIPINCDQHWVQNMCSLLGYKEAAILVKYLGIPLGANLRLVKTWKPIIDKVEEKLNLWKSKAIAEKLISLQRIFLWGKEDGGNDMVLVRWKVVQASKRLGGLGVGDAMLRNTALLFKWGWRFSKEECPLCKKVVCFCNNLFPNQLLSIQDLPTRGGSWKDIYQIHIKEQSIRDQMITGLAMEIGDGKRTHFWKDVWISCGSLKDRLQRLFSVSTQKGFVIGVCGFWDWFEWIWNFQWRRELFQWELKLLNQLHETLRPVKLASDREDRVV
ncbi:uncharacterized protein LOC130948239 [Arachis stenosperma]|uniref:uncharacterized protein LOC130948239 n=1 Tax=Arachis stenosperma TaxID=217475 RepID=UPI0025ACDEE8|nr:uncharacterized protein LOC130948239 [Arachis stenosperma]